MTWSSPRTRGPWWWVVPSESTSCRPHDEVDIPALLVKAGLATSHSSARSAIIHGRVKIEQWTIGIGQMSLPRWVLRDVTLSCGSKWARVSEDGLRVQREAPHL